MNEETVYQNKDGLFYSFWDENRSYYPHFHKQIELHLVLEGHYKTTVDQKTFFVDTGDLLVIFPNQVHSFESAQWHRSLVMIFSTALFPEFENLFENNIPSVPVIRKNDVPKELIDLMLQLHDRFCGGKSPAEYTDVPLNVFGNYSREMFTKGTALLIFSIIVNRSVFVVTPNENGDILRKLVMFCNRNFTQDLSLDEVSKALSVSKFYISHLLTNKLQTTFTQYLNSIRVTEACRKLMNSDLPITEIAFSVGYSTIRTFNRSFLKETGLNPRDYRLQYSLKAASGNDLPENDE